MTQIVGGRGAYRDYPVERAFRDLRTSTLMPPTVDRMLERIGESGRRRLPVADIPASDVVNRAGQNTSSRSPNSNW